LVVAFHAYKTWQVAMTVGHESQNVENKLPSKKVKLSRYRAGCGPEGG